MIIMRLAEKRWSKDMEEEIRKRWRDNREFTFNEKTKKPVEKTSKKGEKKSSSCRDSRFWRFFSFRKSCVSCSGI